MLINRIMQVIVLCVSCVILSGCDNYVVSEKDINQALVETLTDPNSDTISRSYNSSMVMYVDRLDVNLLERKGGLVSAKLTGRLAKSTFSDSKLIGVQITFKSGIKLYENKVFLKDPEISKIYLDGNFIEKIPRIARWPYEHSAMNLFNSYFQKQPIYVLNHSFIEGVMAFRLHDVLVKDEQLEFVFQ